MGRIYKTITEVTDFGPYITKVLLKPDGEADFENAMPDKENFRVYIVRKKISKDYPWPALFGTRPEIPMEGEVKVLNAVKADEMGNEAENGKWIMLEIETDPRNSLNSIINFNGRFNTFIDVNIKVEQLEDIVCKNGFVKKGIYDQNDGNRILLGELLEEGLYDNEDIPLRYVYYRPEKNASDKKYPLIIWLHGGGEGGEDTIISAIGNKVVNLIEPDIQKIFGGAYLLSPQCPTLWMDDGKGGILDTPDTIYANALEGLIQNFIDEHEDIDKDRIYIGGDSNGGYMTIRMIIENPSRYAAGFPVCEGYLDSWFTDETEKKVAEVPLWFTAAKTDNILPVEKYAVPTYKRLCGLDAEVHLTLFDNVCDKTGLYFKEDGSPFEYSGHWSWIPMLNNECRTDYDGTLVKYNGKEVTILEWLAAHKK
ncbi:MAG: prolyl oligopeptidase family serine peptidase [Butyrivibrio sp.]|nr:prolyl oligopeptidase family serine peptidase [Butyrivibrio sp.]